MEKPDLTKASLITRMRKRTQGFLKNRSGQSVTEYILILAIVVMIANKVRTQLSTKVGDSLRIIDTEMTKFENMSGD